MDARDDCGNAATKICLFEYSGDGTYFLISILFRFVLQCTNQFTRGTLYSVTGDSLNCDRSALS